MSGTKEFLALVSKDKDVKLELAVETVTALRTLLAEKGLSDEAQKAVEAVMSKTAKAHGFDINAMYELDEDELKAVAGGDGKRLPTPNEPYCSNTNYYGPGCYNCNHTNCWYYENT